MANYNSKLQSHNTSLQTALQALQNKAVGTDTSDATATADDIMLGETAYVDGEKVTGSFSIDSELSTIGSLITQIQNNLEGKAASGGVGGAVDTCTVTLRGSAIPIGGCYAVRFTEADGILLLADDKLSCNTFEIQNVVCGSILVVRTTIPLLAGYSVVGGAERIYYVNGMWIFFIPQNADEQVIITVRDDD